MREAKGQTCIRKLLKVETLPMMLVACAQRRLDAADKSTRFPGTSETKSMKRFSLPGALLLAVNLCWLAGCKPDGSAGGGGAGTGPIKIGEFASLTGSEASFGR